jgi:hypothetical protein
MENTTNETATIFTDIENQISEIQVRNSERTSPENNKKHPLFLYILCSIIVIGVIGAVITNVIYIIIALVNTSSNELQDICPETNFSHLIFS